MNVKALFENVTRVRVDMIQEEVVQLRTSYDEVTLEELGNSYEDGMLYPVILAPTDTEMYELIIGSRRLRAAKMKQVVDIPAVIIEPASPLNYILMALMENIHREDLNPFEEARVFLRLMKDYGMGVQEVARSTRKSEHFVRHRVELLSLPEEVQGFIAERKIGLQYVRLLAQLTDGESQVHYARKVIHDRLSVAELQTLVARGDGRPPSSRQARKLSPEKVRVRIDMFTHWLKGVPHKAVIKQLNAEERQAINEALSKAEVEIRTLRHLFSPGRSTTPRQMPHSEGNLVERPRNDGTEWPSGDLTKITASNRPSDEVLAQELGRTVSSIRGMRYRLEREERRAK